MEVIVMKVEREEGRAVITGVVRSGIGPLAGDGLDEAFGLAVGLWAIGFGEEMLEAELMAGGGEEFGAIGGAAIGEDLLDFDTVSGVEADGLLQSVQDALESVRQGADKRRRGGSGRRWRRGDFRRRLLGCGRSDRRWRGRLGDGSGPAS